jgi:hypothetical protein
LTSHPTSPERFPPDDVDPGRLRSTHEQNGFRAGHQDRHPGRPMEESAMRYMVIVKANEDSENGVMPSTEELAEMGAFNEELVKAGVMLAGDGLAPSSQGARVRFDRDGKTTVIDGPFAETKELIAGYWILEVSSREEVLEWVRKAPFREAEIEVRRFHDPDDFGEAFTPELREQEARLRAQSVAQHGA